MTDNAGTSNQEHPYREMVRQFKEICAVDDIVAELCIQQADGNLQDAVVRFLSGDALPDANQTPQNEVRRRHVNAVYNNLSTSSSAATSAASTPVSRTPPTQHGGGDNSWSAWFSRLVGLPFQFFYYSVRQVFAFVFGLFGGYFPAITSPEEDLQTFKNEIETKYANVESPLNWHHSTYADALKEAKASVRFLLVYLHNPTHQATDAFLREKLCTQLFKEFIERNGLLIWGTNVRTYEGYRVAQALHEQRYPSLLLICMRDNRLACVQKLSGNEYSTENLINALQQGINQNQRYLNAILNERAQRELNNRLRREQEEEYERALQEDRQKVQERRRLESERIETQKREEEELKELEAKKQRLLDIRQKIRAEIEKYAEPQGETVRVSVRFPCGAKFDRRYSATDSLEILFNTVIAHEKCPEDFSLVSSYPRKELTAAPQWYKEYGTSQIGTGAIPTFKEAGLDSSVVVLVKDNQA